MKKLFAFLMVCGFALAFVACGGSSTSTDETATDTTTLEAPVEADTTASDTTDTTAVN